jgi:hypothetical protein
MTPTQPRPALVLPDDTQRAIIIGTTGSGKTHAAVWQLSRRNYHLMPWIVFDFKNDPLIGQIEGAIEIDVVDYPPRRPGVYVIRPQPEDDDEDVEKFMWNVWRQGNTGVYIDEGYMIDRKNKAWRAMLTQGRSKRIPIITLTQRPVFMDKFAFTEAEFIQVFTIRNAQDIKRIEEYIPHSVSKRLPKHHSYYYNAPDDSLVIMQPLPDAGVILETFRKRLALIPRVQ